ncbi:MAG: DUF547 domain-containing protein [Deltaproteobacteria bacterium]|nr:DUF547 domain-containing protein [Deltaproteobacteria bacterium]
MTLSRIENNILPDLGHPLVVFGLCNGTKGAPALAEVPYRAETLDKQLEERTRLLSATSKTWRRTTTARR